MAWDQGDSLQVQRRTLGDGTWSVETLAGGYAGAQVGAPLLVPGQPWGLHAVWLQTPSLSTAANSDVYYRRGQPQMTRRLWTGLVLSP